MDLKVVSLEIHYISTQPKYVTQDNIQAAFSKMMEQHKMIPEFPNGSLGNSGQQAYALKNNEVIITPGPDRIVIRHDLKMASIEKVSENSSEIISTTKALMDSYQKVVGSFDFIKLGAVLDSTSFDVRDDQFATLKNLHQQYPWKPSKDLDPKSFTLSTLDTIALSEYKCNQKVSLESSHFEQRVDSSVRRGRGINCLVDINTVTEEFGETKSINIDDSHEIIDNQISQAIEIASKCNAI